MEAWNYWQARRRPAMMAGRRVCSGEVRRRRGVDGWLAGHLVHWFARESTGGRKKNVGKKEEKPFFKIKFSKITILPLYSFTCNSQTVTLIWAYHMSTNSYQQALCNNTKVKTKTLIQQKVKVKINFLIYSN